MQSLNLTLCFSNYLTMVWRRLNSDSEQTQEKTTAVKCLLETFGGPCILHNESLLRAERDRLEKIHDTINGRTVEANYKDETE